MSSPTEMQTYWATQCLAARQRAPDASNPDQIELVAAICYAHTFHAREGGDDWERLKLRAEQGAGYAGALVERCYAQAIAILEALSRDN